MTQEQISNIVARVADALGPTAGVQQVEQVAGAVLSSLADGVTATPAHITGRTVSPGQRVIVTAFGCDAPGILAEVTRVVSDSGANILDVSQKILQGYFTLIMIADMGAVSLTVREFQEQLSEVAERLGIRILVQHEELFFAMHRP